MKRLFPFILLLVTLPLYAHTDPELDEKVHHDMHVAERDNLQNQIDQLREQVQANTEGVAENRETNEQQQREIDWNTRKNDQQDVESIIDSATSGGVGTAIAVVKTHRKISEVLHRVYPTPNIESPYPEFPLIPITPPTTSTPPPLPEPPEPYNTISLKCLCIDRVNQVKKFAWSGTRSLTSAQNRRGKMPRLHRR